MTVRMPTAATSVGGTEIPAGSLAFILLAAANRDPAHFPNPESFDVAREPNEHVSFGEGIHSASARRWRGWKAQSRSNRCWTNFPACSSLTHKPNWSIAAQWPCEA